MSNREKGIAKPKEQKIKHRLNEKDLPQIELMLCDYRLFLSELSLQLMTTKGFSEEIQQLLDDWVSSSFYQPEDDNCRHIYVQMKNLRELFKSAEKAFAKPESNRFIQMLAMRDVDVYIHHDAD